MRRCLRLLAVFWPLTLTPAQTIPPQAGSQQETDKNPVGPKAPLPPTKEAVKFMLSESENMRLEVLRLRGELTQVKKALAEAEFKGTQCSLLVETSAYINGVMQTHGNPPGVTFDVGTMTFKTPEK